MGLRCHKKSYLRLTMDVCTRIKADDLRTFLSTKVIDSKYLDNYRVNNVYPALKKFVIGDGETLDGEALQQEVFPTSKYHYDVFISHSHNDLELITKFAAYLEKQCGLSVFLDSYVWKSADGLLRRLDDKYCKDKDGKHYIYKRRNYSTSHVHAMLSMAIMEMIDKTHCSVFVESENSLKLHNLKPTTKAMTLSPWIYEEICMMKYIRPKHQITDTIQKSFSLNEELQIAHSVDVSKLFPITLFQLKDLDKSRSKWLEALYKAIFAI